MVGMKRSGVQHFHADCRMTLRCPTLNLLPFCVKYVTCEPLVPCYNFNRTRHLTILNINNPVKNYGGRYEYTTTVFFMVNILSTNHWHDQGRCNHSRRTLITSLGKRFYCLLGQIAKQKINMGATQCIIAHSLGKNDWLKLKANQNCEERGFNIDFQHIASQTADLLGFFRHILQATFLQYAGFAIESGQ